MPSRDFDTLAAARDLQAAGVAPAHAEAIVTTVAKATGGLLTESRFETAIEDLRTGLRAEFRSELREHRAYMDQRLAELKSELYRYLWIQGGSIIVILSSLYMLAETWSRS